MNATTMQQKTEARGRLYGFLANALRFPDRDFAGKLAEPSTFDGLDRAAEAHLDFDLTQAVYGARRFGCGITLKDLEALHFLAFGHSLRGAVPPYELEYGSKDVFQMSDQLTDVGAFYGAFGMHIDPLSHERLDHIAAQLEFMFLLCAHQAAAAEEQGAEGLQHMAVVRDAQRKFVRDHLGRWGLAFGRRLQAHASDTFLGAIGKLLEAFLVLECRLMTLPPGPAFLELRATGTAEELLAEQACASPVPVPGSEDAADGEEDAG